MPVFKPRNRLVNFRLSEEEFERLRASCSLNGARSLSDFARAAVMRSVATANASSEPAGGAEGTKSSSIDEKVLNLETRISELSRLMQALGGGTENSTPFSAVGTTHSERP